MALDEAYFKKRTVVDVKSDWSHSSGFKGLAPTVQTPLHALSRYASTRCLEWAVICALLMA